MGSGPPPRGGVVVWEKWGVDPRACGVDLLPSKGTYYVGGGSPRMRGRHRKWVSHAQRTGGSRACGVDDKSWVPLDNEQGGSPRMRGVDQVRHLIGEIG